MKNFEKKGIKINIMSALISKPCDIIYSKELKINHEHNLRKNINNIPFHMFGKYKKCEAKYKCSNTTNYIEEMKEEGIFNEIIKFYFI